MYREIFLPSKKFLIGVFHNPIFCYFRK